MKPYPYRRPLIISFILLCPLLLLATLAFALEAGPPDATTTDAGAATSPVMPASIQGSSADDNADWSATTGPDGRWFGEAVAGAGDVNNDGYDDAIVGSPCYFNTYTCQGRAFLYYGSASGLSTSHNWTAGSTNWNGYTYYGRVVASAGDVNGDNYDDIIVTEPYGQGALTRNGIAYVYYGGPSGLPSSPSWTTFGSTNWERFGTSASGAGDVNNDGYDDIIVGAIRDNGGDPGYEGAVFVFHGGPTGLSPTANWSFLGTESGQELGKVVAGVGDVNNDGYDDVLFSAPSKSGGGTVYAAFGGVGGLSGINWTKTMGYPIDYFGWGLDAAGDVNNDSHDDVVVGDADGNAYVFHGIPSGLGSTPSRTLTPPQWLPSYVFPNGAGDVNNDGYDDLVIGAAHYTNGQTDEGAVFLYYGGASGVEAEPAWIIECDQPGCSMGYVTTSQGSAGDVNGDGNGDFIVGAGSYDLDYEDMGKAWAFYGSADVPITGLLAANDGPTSFGAATTLTATIASGTRVSYLWDFDDGMFGDGAVLSHTYANVGTYTVVVTASNAVNLLTATTTVEVVHVPVAGLTAANDGPTELGSPTALTATVSAGTSVNYTWDFGDGMVGSGANTSHTYTETGSFTAVVTATNPLNEQTATTTIYVDVPIAGLTAVGDGPTPLGSATAFTASVTAGSNVAYLWDFDDGNSGTGPTPSHIYGAVGTYSAVVTASNSLGDDTATVVVDVDVPLAGLSAVNDSPRGTGETTTFTATLSSGSRPIFVWAFGDGETGSGAVDSHAYDDVGNYSAVVTATNSLGLLTATTPVTIADAPIVGLVAASDSPTTLGETTWLSATISEGTGVSYLWAFGDGTVGTGDVVSHTYPTYGTFTATVTATNSANTQTATTVVTVSPACLVRLNGTPYATPQDAVNAAAPGDLVQVAGICTGVNNQGVYPPQNLFVAKTVTVRGGYSADFSQWDPDAYPATLDPEGQGRVVTVYGAGIAPRLEGLGLTNGVESGSNGGAGLLSWYASPVISRCHVFSNTITGASGGYGGGIRVWAAPSAVVADSLIYSNTAKWYGGGIAFYSVDEGIISESDILDNEGGTAAGGGGGLYVANSTTISLTRNLFAANTTPRSGGGAYLVGTSGGSFYIQGNVFAANEARNSYGYGGGIDMRDGNSYTFEGNTFVGNKVGNGIDPAYGAGLSLYGSGSGRLVNNIVADNQILGSGDYGAGIYYSSNAPDAEMQMLHTTFARNQGGAGLYVGGNKTVYLTNTLVASHTIGIHAGNFGQVIMNGAMWGDDEWANDTDWTNDVLRTSESWGSPDFAGLDNGDYHIGWNSDALDTGVDSGVTQDIDGDPRPAGFEYDIGADEFHYETMEIEPGMANTLPGGTLTFDVPGTYTEPLRVFYIPWEEPVADTGSYQFAGMAFFLEAYDPDWNEFVTLTYPISLTIHYDEGDLPPDLDEAALELHRYDQDALAWVPLPVLERDLPGDNLTVLLDHFSDFALVAAPCAPAMAPTLSLSLSGQDVILNWDATGSQYEVWISSDPYFDPAHPGGVTPVITSNTGYTDAGAVASGATYYVVRALDACGLPSPDSNHMGTFTFDLEPGE